MPRVFLKSARDFRAISQPKNAARVLAVALFFSAATVVCAQPRVVPQDLNQVPPQVVSRDETPRAATSSLRLQLWSEQRSGVFYESETLKTRTPLVFSVRLFDDAGDERPATLFWDIEDARGKTIWKRDTKFRTAPGAFIQGRELFDVPGLGAYRLRVRAFAKSGDKHRANDAEVVLPFAVVQQTRAGFRPRSFFALTAPANLNDDELDMYARFGARVLRSPWNADDATLDNQLQERLQRRIATWGVFSTDAARGLDGAGGSEALQQQMAQLASRFRAVTRWELSGDGAAGDLPPILPANARDSTAQWLRPARGNGAAQNDGWDGVVFDDAPAASTRETQQIGDGASSQLRALLWARAHSTAPRGDFFVASSAAAQDDDTASQTPRDAAGELASRYLLGILGNVSSLSVRLNSGGAAQQMARGAAFSELNSLLEDAVVEDDLFPSSPMLWGIAFRTPQQHIAALWLDSSVTREDDAAITVPLTQARVLDVFGNEIARSKNNMLRVPLSDAPVYVVSGRALTQQFAARAWADAKLDGVRPLAVRALPLTQQPPPRQLKKNAPLNKRAFVPQAINASMRVQVQNVSNRPSSGTLRLFPPGNFKLKSETQAYRLAAGETRIYSFPLTQWENRLDNSYPLTVEARADDKKSWRWKQRVLVATAQPATRGVQVDGDLGEWNDSTWMEARAENKKSRVLARVALRYDARNVYIAARVEEPSLQPRQGDAAYRFWNGFDALQIAFGLRDDASVKPSRAPFRDTDFGFLLSPFESAPFDNAGGRDLLSGRVLRLWSNTLPFGTLRDETRWGGAVPGAICIVRRDETRHITTYEASLPLSEMPTLRPNYRGARDIPVRFNWILHTDEGPALQWSRVTDTFPWWKNPASMLPPQNEFLAAQTPLGFSVGASESLPQTAPPIATQQSQPPTASTTRPQNNPPQELPELPPARPLPPAANGESLPPLPPSPPME